MCFYYSVYSFVERHLVNILFLIFIKDTFVSLTDVLTDTSKFLETWLPKNTKNKNPLKFRLLYNSLTTAVHRKYFPKSLNSNLWRSCFGVWIYIDNLYSLNRLWRILCQIKLPSKNSFGGISAALRFWNKATKEGNFKK
jgi:hypothetical protein